MKNSDIKFYAPVLIGLAGCFLPYAGYNIPPEWFYPSFIGNFGGWATVLIILLFGVFSFFRKKNQKPVPSLLEGIIGIYLAGLTLFRLYHTLVVFQSNNENNLAEHLKVSAYPREGLFLVMIAGCWLMVRAFGKKT